MTYYTMIILHALTGNALEIHNQKLLEFEQCRYIRRAEIERWRANGVKVHIICYPSNRLQELYPWTPNIMHNIPPQ